MINQKDPLTGKVIGCAIEVHRNIGAGLLESTYEQCLIHELDLQGISHKSQCKLPINYKGKNLHDAYRIDLLINNSLII